MADGSQHSIARAWYTRRAIWIGGAIVAAIALFGLLQLRETPFTLSYSQLRDQLQAGNIAAVSFSGTQVDGRFKTAVEEAGKSGLVAHATFHSALPDFGDPDLLGDLHTRHVVIDVAYSSGWASWLAKLPWPMLLILSVLLVVAFSNFRRGGTGAQGAAALPKA
jgi:ATP-dependent Zn protease